MYLYVNGCSFTFGHELIDDPTTGKCLDDKYRLKHSWPGRLESYMGFEDFHNDSENGSSNDRILRTTIDWILRNWIGKGSESKDLFVVIGWSEVMRREFYIEDQWRQLIPYHNYKIPSVNKFNKIYRELAWNEYESAVRFASQLIALQSFLKQFKVKYLFFDALRSITEVMKDDRGQISVHASHVDTKRYFNFEREGGDMRTVIKEKIPIWEKKHPPGEGHDFWAKQLTSYIYEEELLID